MLTRSRVGRLFANRTVRAACLVGVGGILASCSASGPQAPKFSEAEYGKSSPRVVASNRKVPDGGGRYIVGEPYRVAGRTYIPQDNPVGYTATGYASWYGNNFHGRKTANGEVYDMRDLSAAHPTLPLPCYVRVTNLANGRSVMVRVNDRGPFTHNRVIDVSSQAASMLDFKRAGTAKVQVEYIGRARLDGRDGDMLMASYRGPGGVPARTMVASNDARLPKPGVFTPGTKTRPTIDFGVADEGMAFGTEPLPAGLSDPIAPLILQTGICIVLRGARTLPLHAGAGRGDRDGHGRCRGRIRRDASTSRPEDDTGGDVLRSRQCQADRRPLFGLRRGGHRRRLARRQGASHRPGEDDRRSIGARGRRQARTFRSVRRFSRAVSPRLRSCSARARRVRAIDFPPESPARPKSGAGEGASMIASTFATPSFVPRSRAVLCLVALLLAALPWSGAHAQGYETKAKQAILIDVETGTVLFEKDADARMPPASMAKLMTMAVVFQAIREGRLKLDQEFVVSEAAWRQGGAPSRGTTMFAALEVSSIRVEDLIRGVIVQSANDGCIILAEGMAGSQEAFAKLMNEEAARLGLVNSHFTNPTGYVDPAQYMSARDLATLTGYLIREFPEYYKIYSEPEFTWNKIRQLNRNPLLAMNVGADGLTTGSTDEFGFGLAGSTVRNGQRLILVINGVETSDKQRNEEAKKLIEWGYNEFERVRLFDSGEVVAEARVFGGAESRVGLVSKGPLELLLPLGSRDMLKAEVHYDGPLPAPVEAGREVGIIKVTTSEGMTMQAPVYTAADVGGRRPAAPGARRHRGAASRLVVAGARVYIRAMAGKFITFEGGEGAGKSTQIRRLATRLEERRAAAS